MSQLFQTKRSTRICNETSYEEVEGCVTSETPRTYLKSVCGAAVQRRRFSLDDERVDGLGQENRQGPTSDEIGVAGYGRGLVVAVIVILDGIALLLVILLDVVRFLRTWREFAVHAYATLANERAERERERKIR